MANLLTLSLSLFYHFLVLLLVSPSGFAVNLQVILANPRALFKRRGSQPGMQESDFLKQITKVTDLEPKANNCTRVSSLSPRQQIENPLDYVTMLVKDLLMDLCSSLGHLPISIIYFH